MIYFILGGARSGKSRHAEQLAKDYEQQGKRIIYVATAGRFDDEMVKRMAKVQYRLRNDIMPYYKAATSRNNRGNKNRDNNNDGGAWGKANII